MAGISRLYWAWISAAVIFHFLQEKQAAPDDFETIPGQPEPVRSPTGCFWCAQFLEMSMPKYFSDRADSSPDSAISASA